MTNDKSKSSFDELAAAIPTTLTGAPSAPPPKRSASNAPPPITPVKARGSWTPTRDAAGNRAPRWDKWGKMPVIHLWEGVALSLNLDPGKVRQEYSWMAEARFFDESQEFKDRLEVAERSVGRHPLLRRECNSLVDPCDYLVSIDSFIAWAKSIGWDLPDGGLRSQPPKQNAPIEITLPAGGGGYMRLGDALETVPMLIAFALFPRGGEMVRGAKRIENGVEIIKQSQGPDDTEIKKLIESGEWTPITMDMEIYQRTMRNEVAQEWREKLESAAEAGRLAIIDSLSRLPATGKNPENLIPIHALKDWCASMGVAVKENRHRNIPNIDFWKQKELWTLIEAACLLSGKPPQNPREFNPHPTTGELSAQIYDALKDAIQLRKIEWFESRDGYIRGRRVKPSDVVSWAINRGYNPPSVLLDLAERDNPESATGGNGLIKMNEPKTKDDWFYVFRDCIRAFESEYGYTPNAKQLWARLIANPPPEYGITWDSKKESLLIPGARPLDKDAFRKRYSRLYPPNSDK